MSVLLTDKLQPRTTGIAITVVGDMDVTGNISVAGTVTYEDVTNVDSIGVITARSGINVSGGELLVGSNIKGGTAGVLTATSFVGSGANLTGVASTDYIITGTAATFNNKVNINSTLTASEGINVSAGVGTFAGNVSIADKIIHTGDTNTAIRFPAADTITAETGGTERLRITSAGRVGIDTTAPRCALDLGDNDHTDAATLSNTPGDYQLGVHAAQSATGDIARNIGFIALNANKVTAAINSVDDGTNDTSGLLFATGNGSGLSERLKITGGGDINLYGTATGVSSVTWDASANSLIFNDNSKAVFGTSSDGFSIYHDGSQSRILENGTGGLRIGSDTGIELNKGTSENMLVCTPDAEVKAYYNNSKKWETTNDGTVTTGISTATAFVPTEGQLSNRNIIINGDMAIWQRGTTAINSSVNKYLVDRFKVLSVSDGDGSISQHTNVPTQVQTGGVQFAYSLRLNCTTADTSLAANQYIIVSQRIEGRNLRHLGFGLAGTRYATLQFWQRSPAGTYYVSFRNGSYNRYYLGSYTIASANTWEKHSITIPIDTQGTWASDNSTGLDIQWSLGTGSATGSVGSWTGGSSHAGSGQFNFFGTVGNDFYLTGVQFEAGSVVTPFESIDYGSELAKCQRYYYPITAPEGFINATEDIGIGRPNSSTEVQLRVSPPAQMRDTPSVEATTGSQYFRISNGNLGGDKYLSNAWNINNMSPTGGFLYTQPDDNLGSYIGESATVQSKSTSARMALQSEL